MDVATPDAFVFFLSVIHSLKYITTGSFGIPNFPEYLSVGYVDGVQISHYDSKTSKAKAKQEWMKNIAAEEPHYWERQTHLNIVNQDNAKDNIEILQERFNQTGGLHIIQHMFGCQWDDETDQVVGWYNMSYNGEDFIWFDLKRLQWIAVQPQAVVTRNKWDRDEGYNEHLKFYMREECPSYLKKYVSFGRDVLMRTELPRVFLLQKTAGSPVTCHTTGFYPRAAVLFWRKDGKRLDENVEVNEILPNHDGTFQNSARLVTVDEHARYECVFQLDGVPEDVVTPLDHGKVLSNECIQDREWWRKIDGAFTTLFALFLAAFAISVIMFERAIFSLIQQERMYTVMAVFINLLPLAYAVTLFVFKPNPAYCALVQQDMRNMNVVNGVLMILLSLAVAVTVFVIKCKRAKYTPAPTCIDSDPSQTSFPKAASSPEADGAGVAYAKTAFTQATSSKNDAAEDASPKIDAAGIASAFAQASSPKTKVPEAASLESDAPGAACPKTDAAGITSPKMVFALADFLRTEAPEVTSPLTDASGATSPKTTAPGVCPRRLLPRPLLPRLKSPRLLSPRLKSHGAASPKTKVSEATSLETDAPEVASPLTDASRATSPKTTAPGVYPRRLLPRPILPRLKSPRLLPLRLMSRGAASLETEVPEATSLKTDAPEVASPLTDASGATSPKTTAPGLYPRRLLPRPLLPRLKSPRLLPLRLKSRGAASPETKVTEAASLETDAPEVASPETAFAQATFPLTDTPGYASPQNDTPGVSSPKTAFAQAASETDAPGAASPKLAFARASSH
ncbi:uncharacterized protein LOC130918412 [Corythoichthys intestinalis]|uniref:uncharacterized protein LOC130918412 n=1 Tax=Corythoichthys intestinalis TaxID=161448 RepID=UPI0025A58FEC|nr:uncharacterized protein LOC130918412 [Corythoichthys intestinalis]